MEEKELPSVGATVEVTYEICQPGPTYGHENTVTFEVDKQIPGGFIGGAGIGNKVQHGSFLTPTSSDGYSADGDHRMKIGRVDEWSVVEANDDG